MAHLYPTAEAVTAAMSTLGSTGDRRLYAVPTEDGGYELHGPAEVLALLDTGPSKERLKAYANAEQWRRATGGYTATIDGTSHFFPTDETSYNLMTGKAKRLDQPGAQDPFRWQLPAGYISISVADFRTVAVAIADYMQATFDALEPILDAIDAGTITTFAEIDTASWPA